MSAEIAILMPVHNAPGELEESLESLQGHEEAFVCYVVDDGSTPPVRIERDYGFPVELLRLDVNRGITAALNVGLEAIVAAGFPYIARLDAGDLAFHGRFSAQKAFLRANPDHGLVSTGYEVVDDSGRKMFEVVPPTAHGQIRRVLFYRNPILHPGIMFNGVLFRDGLRYDERFRAGQDYEIIRRIARRSKVANLPEILNRYRYSATSITARRKYRYFGRLRIQLMHFEYLNLHSYLGVVRSLAICLIPFGLIHRVRALRNRFA